MLCTAARLLLGGLIDLIQNFIFQLLKCFSLLFNKKYLYLFVFIIEH